MLLNKSCLIVLFCKSCSSLYGPSSVSLLRDAAVAERDICDDIRDTDVGKCDSGVAHATPVSPSEKNSLSSIPSKRGVAVAFARGGTGTIKNIFTVEVCTIRISLRSSRVFSERWTVR